MKFLTTILEEELKNRVRDAFFEGYDASAITGKIDFVVKPSGLYNDANTFLWAEAKKGNKHNIFESLVQLILTIGKAKTYDNEVTPQFIGAFDCEEIAFLPYIYAQEILSRSSINWNKITPSNHSEEQFQGLTIEAKKNWTKDLIVFKFERDEKDIREFIKKNFVLSSSANPRKRQITRNNFVSIFQDWYKEVRPSIRANWSDLKKGGVEEVDFYFADIFSDNDNKTVIDNLAVILQDKRYIMATGRAKFAPTLFTTADIIFSDGQRSHRKFWNRYNRPAKKEFWEYIQTRRDLCVLQDVRERKGAFFTPRRWVELSQEYIARTLGENWQDEYYIWDCCAGTGNLLAGLTDKYRIWASTLDNADVKIMREQAQNNHSLLENHIFQFDFLNDDFSKLKDEGQSELYEIINDPERRKKLVIYINPPYKEATNAKEVSGTGENISGLTKGTKPYKLALPEIGTAAREIYAMFLLRIKKELDGLVLAEFSKLKILQASNFKKFRQVFRAKLESMFLVPGNTFDNVKGDFPIGFKIWDLSKDCVFESIVSDVYNPKGKLIGKKEITNPDQHKLLTDFLKTLHDKNTGKQVGYLTMNGSDTQHNRYTVISNGITDNTRIKHLYTDITRRNLFGICVYFCARQVIKNTWLNDRDQYLYPLGEWKDDKEFQSDCLAYSLFSNNVSTEYGVNHWIPFYPAEVNAKDNFQSTFMADFLAGKVRADESKEETLFEGSEKKESFIPTAPVEFSAQAKAVMDAGRELYKYYHAQDYINVNASFYDIRSYFQGTTTNENTGKSRMNSSSEDEEYTRLLRELSVAQKILAKKIEGKIYEYHFLEGQTFEVVEQEEELKDEIQEPTLFNATPKAC